MSVGSTDLRSVGALGLWMLAQFFIAAATTTPTLHCSDPAAANYQQIPDGVAAPWLCTYLAYGCGDPLADNFARRLPVPPAAAQRDPRRAADERGEPHPERAVEPGIGEVVE